MAEDTEVSRGIRKQSRIDADCPLASVLADRLRLARHDLTLQWLGLISIRDSLDLNHVFSTNVLVN